MGITQDRFAPVAKAEPRPETIDEAVSAVQDAAQELHLATQFYVNVTREREDAKGRLEKASEAYDQAVARLAGARQRLASEANEADSPDLPF